MPLQYEDKEAERLLRSLYDNGFTQAGVDALYSRLGLGPAPTVPPSLVGQRLTQTRGGLRLGSSQVTGDSNSFLNTFRSQAEDPYRVYGAGSYLGLAGMLAGAAGAAGAFAPSAAGGASAGGSSGLGIFSNGGAAGMAGVGGGNAGALAASGAITGGAGVAGFAGMGGIGRALNSLSGISAGGNGMGWDWGTILEYGAPIVGGLLEREGSRDAARASEAGAREAIAENRRQYDTTRQDMMPWLTAGGNALARLEDPTPNFATSPGYNFVRSEGNRNIENSFAARGGAASGNALRALTEFNTGLASNEYNNWWNQQAGLAGVGQTTAQNLGAFGANNAANVGSLMQGAGNARASGIEGGTNALSGTIQNLLSIWQRRRGGY
jgi:hypothetical protein